MINKEQLDIERLPAHIAIIMDGNGRWAKKKGNPRVFGHKNGVAAVRDTVEGAAELGIKYLTLYAFSTENWNRPRTEVDALMSLLVNTINKETKTLLDNNVRLAAIGDIESLPSNVAANLRGAIDKTKTNTGLTLVLALSYSARWEIIKAVKNIAEEVKSGKLNVSEIDNTTFSNYLTTKEIPDPELLIRTSGESRISNFLLWQIAYSELYFTHVLWPDFRRENLYEAIADYQCRERRFGKTSDQVSEKIQSK
ncbi:MAG: isoprenyl transferase [Bacteroidales bacterium]|nr:isoprenyl transferase [Bacteroidales bacterium]MBN2819402.1 isoprenyl transferase [Bacteroidales bacterium]